MNQFVSSLVVNSKQSHEVHKVFNPRFNKEFFKRVTANVENLVASIQKRASKDDYCSDQDLNSFIQDSKCYVKIKNQFDQLEKKLSEAQLHEINQLKTRLQDLEDKLLPFAVRIPNRWSKHVPPKDVILEELSSDHLAKANLSKVLSHIKLSFINNCYTKSVIGPNSHYYYGIGAKLQYGLSDFFISELEKDDFLLFSGLCLAKSAVVEATNSYATKDYSRDPCRILTEEPSLTSKHVVEASRESMLGFITTLGHRTTNNPLRLMTSGAGYRSGSDWFDSDDGKVSQYQTLHTLTLTPSIEQYSIKEYLHNRDILWAIYKKLELTTRLVQCSLDSMYSNEYDSHRIDVWLPSRQQWIQAGRISHYLDYITVRAGMKRGHIVDSMVYDGQALTAAIIENNQTSNGKFIIPAILEDHIGNLSEQERSSYLRGDSSHHLNSHLKHPLNNFEQRRYFKPPHKRSSVFSHSKFAQKQDRPGKRQIFYIWFIGSGMCLMMFDWTEIYRIYVPTRLKRFTYNYIYRPIRRVWWRITFTDYSKMPPDLPFDSEDWSQLEVSLAERRKESFYGTFDIERWDKRDKS